MENKTAKELKQIAKERKIKYYYKLTKQDLVRALQPIIQRPVPAPRPVVATRSTAQSPIPAPRPVSNDLISFRPVRLQNRVTRVESAIIDEPFQDTTNIITPRPVPAPRPVVATPGLFSRFKTTAINAVNHGFNQVLAVIDPYVPTPVKNVVRNVKKGVGETIKSLKDLVFSTPVPAPRPIPAPHLIVFKLTKHAVKNVTRQYSYEAERGKQDASVFLERVRDAALKIMGEEKNKKVNFVLKCEMSRLSIVTGEEITEVIPFASKSKIVLEMTNIGELYDTAKEQILENISNFSSNGSNWKVSNILRMDINMINYNPLSASSWIELDKFLIKKNAVINMQNEDNECFKWCVTRALNMKKKNNERVDKELIEKSKELNWKGIEFPFELNQIGKFEKKNPDISVTVCSFKDKKPIPMNQLKNYGRKHHIDLLLISNDVTHHYCLIKNFSRLMNSSKSKHHGKKYYSRNCMRGYSSEKVVSKHWPYCKRAQLCSN